MLKTTSGSSPGTDLSSNITFSQSKSHATFPLKHCLQGSSDGSLVGTPDCETAVWVRIQQSPQPTVTVVLRWAAIWDGISL
jgi:hypothetical protein